MRVCVATAVRALHHSTPSAGCCERAATAACMPYRYASLLQYRVLFALAAAAAAAGAAGVAGGCGCAAGALCAGQVMGGYVSQCHVVALRWCSTPAAVTWHALCAGCDGCKTVGERTRIHVVTSSIHTAAAIAAAVSDLSCHSLANHIRPLHARCEAHLSHPFLSSPYLLPPCLSCANTGRGGVHAGM